MRELIEMSAWFWSFLPLLLAAFLSGAIVGFERQHRHSPIGVRTCTLVCAGATTYMAAGHLILEVAGMPGDPTRIASQIITGIGFLGAGAIMRETGGVHGITSAATIWFLGAVGILIGCNYALIGILLTTVVVGLVVLLGKLERVLAPG